jgi:hypothetical protein
MSNHTRTLSRSRQRCPADAYGGAFHFHFNKTGFTGSYGTAMGQPRQGSVVDCADSNLIYAVN